MKDVGFSSYLPHFGAGRCLFWLVFLWGQGEIGGETQCLPQLRGLALWECARPVMGQLLHPGRSHYY